MTILSGHRHAIVMGEVEDGIRPFIVRPAYRPDPERIAYLAVLRKHWVLLTLGVLVLTSWGYALHALPVVH